MPAVLRFHTPATGSTARFGVLHQEKVYDVSQEIGSLTSWLKSSVGDVPSAVRRLEAVVQSSQPVCSLEELGSTSEAGRFHLLSPLESQEVWAAGVTYERSRTARQEEAQDGGDVYARVYNAARPEIFFKSYGEKVVGPGGDIGIRADAAVTVPEPELAVLLNPNMDVVGFTVGNDLSSRDIEGANPLYLPQAKIYTGSCALGPVINLSPQSDWPLAAIMLAVHRQGQVVFEDSTHTRRIHRSLSDLVDYLGRSNHFPNGLVLLTGTGIVPPLEFSLQPGDLVTIEIEGIGVLANPVVLV